jgi:hypothetical protein
MKTWTVGGFRATDPFFPPCIDGEGQRHFQKKHNPHNQLIFIVDGCHGFQLEHERCSRWRMSWWCSVSLCGCELLLVSGFLESEREWLVDFEGKKARCLLGLLWDGSQLLLMVDEVEVIWWGGLASHSGWGYGGSRYRATRGGVAEQRWFLWETVGGKIIKVICLDGAFVASIVASHHTVVEEILVKIGF